MKKRALKTKPPEVIWVDTFYSYRLKSKLFSVNIIKETKRNILLPTDTLVFLVSMILKTSTYMHYSNIAVYIPILIMPPATTSSPS